MTARGVVFILGFVAGVATALLLAIGALTSSGNPGPIAQFFNEPHRLESLTFALKVGAVAFVCLLLLATRLAIAVSSLQRKLDRFMPSNGTLLDPRSAPSAHAPSAAFSRSLKGRSITQIVSDAVRRGNKPSKELEALLMVGQRHVDELRRAAAALESAFRPVMDQMEPPATNVTTLQAVNHAPPATEPHAPTDERPTMNALQDQIKALQEQANASSEPAAVEATNAPSEPPAA